MVGFTVKMCSKKRMLEIDRQLEYQVDQQETERPLVDLYSKIRRESLKICENLATEDYVVQPCGEVSPPKWHLGHTTWFFEELVLVQHLKNYQRFDEGYRQLFNSYYKSAGEHWVQSERGQLSRPTVAEVFSYREYVDRAVLELLNSEAYDSSLEETLRIGLHHEQQHQELLYMDIKYILGVNPSLPTYMEGERSLVTVVPAKWIEFTEGLYEIGHSGDSFSYDNERPRHKNYIYPFSISDRLVTNGEYLEFIESGGYEQSKYWLSMGWDWVKAKSVGHPLYWFQKDDIWFEYTLHGSQPIELDAPVSHISYFEADAFANWKGARLPTEQELELYLSRHSASETLAPRSLHPSSSAVGKGQLWCWTRSQYSPYPGFQTFDGMLEEYNGKFMCNQFVLRGGCMVTPRDHYRTTYRNFYLPEQRWMFSGICLAKDL